MTFPTYMDESVFKDRKEAQHSPQDSKTSTDTAPDSGVPELHSDKLGVPELGAEDSLRFETNATGKSFKSSEVAGRYNKDVKQEPPNWQESKGIQSPAELGPTNEPNVFELDSHGKI